MPFDSIANYQQQLKQMNALYTAFGIEQNEYHQMYLHLPKIIDEIIGDAEASNIKKEQIEEAILNRTSLNLKFTGHGFTDYQYKGIYAAADGDVVFPLSQEEYIIYNPSSGFFNTQNI